MEIRDSFLFCENTKRNVPILDKKGLVIMNGLCMYLDFGFLHFHLYEFEKSLSRFQQGSPLYFSVTA